jgi:hypothetical protein
MKQVISSQSTLFTAGTNYGPLMGVGSSGNATQIIPTAGTLSNFRVKLSAAPGTGAQGYTLSVLINGSPQLSVAITGTGTTGVDTSSVAVAAGDEVIVSIAPVSSPTPNNVPVWYAVTFEGDVAGESILLGCSSAVLNTTTTYYGPISGILVAGVSATESAFKQIIPTPGTIKKLYWKLSADPGTSPDTYRLTVRKSGASQALTADIVADAVSGNDTTNSFTVAAGDDVNVMFEPVSTPSVAPRAYWGMVFVADTNGESLMLGGGSANLANNGTRYSEATAEGRTFGAGESFTLMNACTLKKFFVELSGSPYANSTSLDKFSFFLRLASVDTALTVAIVDGGTGNTVGNDITHTADVTDGQVLAISSVPASSPTTRSASWGFVCYIQPITNYSLSVDSGSFALSGTVAGLRATRKLTVGSGSFSETGTAATLKFNHPLAAGSGTFVESGTAVGLLATRKLTAGSGTFSESGTAASLVRTYKVSAVSGTFIETGAATGLRATRLLSAVGATFLESGTAAILNYSGTSAVLVAVAGAVNLSGTVAALYRNAVLATASGSFAEAGTIAALYRGNLKILASPGDYFLTGSPTSLLRKALLTALSGSFVLSGTNAAINPGGFKIIAGSGAFLISGDTAYFPRPGSSKTCFIFQKRRDHFRI